MDITNLDIPKDANYVPVSVLYVLTEQGFRPVTSTVFGETAVLGIRTIQPAGFESVVCTLSPFEGQTVTFVQPSGSILMESRGMGNVYFGFGGKRLQRELLSGETYSVDLRVDEMFLQASGATTIVLIDYTFF